MTIAPRRAHSSPERLLQDTAIREREAYLQAVNRLTGPMEDWRQVGDPGEPNFQNGWDHAYRVKDEDLTGIEGTGQWVLFPQPEGGFKRVFLLPGFHPYPQWFIDYLSTVGGLSGTTGKSILYAVQFRKDNEGFVYVEGIAGKKGASATRWNLETIFALPDTHRPAYREIVGTPDWHRVTTFDPATGFPRTRNYYLPGEYIVEPDGRIRVINPNTSGAFHLSFRSKFLVLTPQ